MANPQTQNNTSKAAPASAPVKTGGSAASAPPVGATKDKSDGGTGSTGDAQAAAAPAKKEKKARVARTLRSYLDASVSNNAKSINAIKNHARGKVSTATIELLEKANAALKADVQNIPLDYKAPVARSAQATLEPGSILRLSKAGLKLLPMLKSLDGKDLSFVSYLNKDSFDIVNVEYIDDKGIKVQRAVTRGALKLPGEVEENLAPQKM